MTSGGCCCSERRRAGEEGRTGAREWGVVARGANESEKEGERWVTGTDRGRGDVDRAGNDVKRVECNSRGCELVTRVQWFGRGFLNVGEETGEI